MSRRSHQDCPKFEGLCKTLFPSGKNLILSKILKHLKDILNHKGFKKYSQNTAWLIGDKLTNMILGLLVGIWVARYLGPEKFGLLNYVAAFTALFIPLSGLGFDGIITRDLVKNETNANILLSSGFVFKFIGSLLLVVTVSAYMLLLKEEPVFFYLGLIISSKYIFKSFEVIELYYRAKVKTKYIFISKFFGHILSSLLKVFGILTGCGLVFLGGAQVSLFFFTMIFLLYFFKREDAHLSFNYFNLTKGLNLLRESWPLIFSGFFAIVYLNIDKIMIEEMLGSHEVGQYSVAVRISSVWYFIPMYISLGILPAIVNAKKKDEDLYYKRLGLVFSTMALISYVIILPISFFSNDIINFLFGKQYADAGSVLTIHIFSLLFFFIGSGRGLWVVNESYFKFDLFANVGAGILNVILNFLFLPKMGIIGAAYATLISYSFTFFFSNIFFKPARKIFAMQAKSLLLVELLINFRKQSIF